MNAGFFLLIVLGFGGVLITLLVILKHIKALNLQIKALHKQVETLSTYQLPSNPESGGKPKNNSPEVAPHSGYTGPVTLPLPQKSARPIRQPLVIRQIDWEKFIGENLINKIGIIILVLGIGFFVRYAIEQDWITETGRVLIGILCGGILLGTAHWLRIKYPAFSSVLVGGGLAIFYFTVALAFHQYQLLSSTAAFVCMVAITGLSVFMALLYNRKELAVLAILGGFGSPFITSTGGNDYIILFSYVLILNAGMLVLAYFKRWPIITFISYGATLALYAGWLFSGVAWVKNAPYLGTWLFGVLFYITFFLMDIMYNLRRDRKFTLPEMALLISNTSFFYITAIFLLSNIQHGSYQGLYTAGLALFNGITAWVLFSRSRSDWKFIYLLSGLSFSFFYLALLLELLFQMQVSTIFFETRILLIAIYHYLLLCILLFYAPRTRIFSNTAYVGWLSLGAVLSYIFLALSIIPTLRNNYVLTGNNGAIYYLHFAALLLIVFIVFSGYKLIRDTNPAPSSKQVITTWLMATSLVFIVSTELDNILVISLFSSTKSINYLLNQSHKIGFALLWSISSFSFMLAGMKFKNKTLRIISLTLFALTLLKLFLFDIKNLSAGNRISAFILLGILLLIVSFLYQKLKHLIFTDPPDQNQKNHKSNGS